MCFIFIDFLPGNVDILFHICSSESRLNMLSEYVNNVGLIIKNFIYVCFF